MSFYKIVELSLRHRYIVVSTSIVGAIESMAQVESCIQLGTATEDRQLWSVYKRLYTSRQPQVTLLRWDLKPSLNNANYITWIIYSIWVPGYRGATDIQPPAVFVSPAGWILRTGVTADYWDSYNRTSLFSSVLLKLCLKSVSSSQLVDLIQFRFAIFFYWL